jgi:hypothetical protein
MHCGALEAPGRLFVPCPCSRTIRAAPLAAEASDHAEHDYEGRQVTRRPEIAAPGATCLPSIL